jgi:S1-C subfamily serine protease
MKEKGAAVFILSPPGQPDRGGTGFVVRGFSGKSYTLTNSHVCAGAREGVMEARKWGAQRGARLRVLDVSDTSDLCLLETVGASEPLRLGYELEANQPVVVIGHPHLQPLTPSAGVALERDTTSMYVDLAPSECTGPAKKIETVDTIFGSQSVCVFTLRSMLTSAVIYPGNSGSPVLDSDGLVVGVVFAGDRRSNYGVIIPLEDVADFLSVY